MRSRHELEVPAPFVGWPHVERLQQFARAHFEYLMDLADGIDLKIDGARLEGDRVAILFDKPSKRTYFSFRLAVERLGARVIADDTMFSNASRYQGESIQSVLDMFTGGNFIRLFVLRLPEDWIKRVVTGQERVVPVINAGWDTLQHPTQAILDGHAIRKRHGGTLDGIKILFTGNANSRATRSLAYLLGKFDNVTMTFATLMRYRLDPGLRHYLEKEHRVTVREVFPRDGELRELAAQHDGIYSVRLHDDNDEGKMSPGAKSFECLTFQITQGVIDALPEKGFVHHPLPCTPFELTQEVLELNDSRRGGKVIAVEAMADSGIKTRQALSLYLLEHGPRNYS